MQHKTLTLHHGRAPTVAFLVDLLEDSYQWSILRGALDGARDRGANLFCFAGGVVGAPGRWGGQRNGVYDLVGPENVDAIVLLAGTMGNHIGPERLREYCARFRPLPMCSIALEIEGISSVCVDNDVGMRLVLSHLVQRHQMTRIAFVRGPDANPEAERRFAVYRQTLAEAGIPFDDRLVLPGDFRMEGGQRAVDVLFDQRKLKVEDVEAIACANDSMALGVLDALEGRGVRVPERIAIVGFDDVEEVRFTTPPLTTVRQPLHRQGREAVGMVLDQIRDGTRVERVVLPTELVTRRSCRCFTKRSGLNNSAGALGRLGFEALLVGRRQLILADLSRAARGAFSAAGAGWEQRLLSSFTDQVRGDSAAAFVETYDDILRRLAQSEVDLSICFEVVATFRKQILACLANEPNLKPLAEDLFQEAGELTASVMERAQAWQRIHTQHRARSLGRAGSAMVTTFDLDELAYAVSESLPDLGIERCYVSVFGRGQGPDREARLILAFDAGARLAQAPGGLTFRAGEIVPRSVLPVGRELAFAVSPLVFRDEELGLLVLELGAADGYVYEALRELFAAAIKGAHLLDTLSGRPPHLHRLAHELEEARARKASLEAVQATLSAALGKCSALAPQDGPVRPEVASLEADLTAARREIDDVLAALQASPSPRSSAPPARSSTPGEPPALGGSPPWAILPPLAVSPDHEAPPSSKLSPTLTRHDRPPPSSRSPSLSSSRPPPISWKR